LGFSCDSAGRKKMPETGPKPFVFVLMPFDEKFEEIYKLGIKPACVDAHAYCERVDEQIFEESILDRIYNQISKADMIISDMTDRNPNVFYETGYAHALKKRVILLTQDEKDIPFDLKHYAHIIYGGKILSLKDQLVPRLMHYISKPEAPQIDPLDGIEIYLEKEQLLDNITVVANEYNASMLYLNFFMFNKNLHVANLSNAKISLIRQPLPEYDYKSEDFTLVLSERGTTLPDGNEIQYISLRNQMFPHDWQSTTLYFAKNVKTAKKDALQKAILRISTPYSVRDIHFFVKYIVSVNNAKKTNRL
jgi:hypothetical protein